MRLLVSILTPTALMLACGTSAEGGDPDDIGETSSALYNGDTPDTEVIARAQYWYDEGQNGHMEKYTNTHCSITGLNSDGTKDTSCHRDVEGNGVYPNTHFYRRDCSGMASMAVHMSYSTNTAGFRDGDFDFQRLADDADAKSGDLLLSTAASSSVCAWGNHTIIFDHWIDGTHWKGYSGGVMPPTHSTYTVTKDNGVITNMDKYDGCNRVFHAWRSPHVLHGPSCSPKTCSQLGLACGAVTKDENCGVALSCGGCGTGETCDSGQCAPTPTDSYAQTWFSGRLKNSGECAAPSSTGTIEMKSCSSGALGEEWHITSARHLKNDKTDQCLGPDALAAGSLTREQTCGSDDQILRFRNMRVVSGQTGYCMDVPMADFHAGQRVIQWPCHGADNQLFTYKPQTGELRIDGWCLDAGAAQDGEQITLQSCDDGVAQKWNDAHGGFVSQVATSKARCIALEGGASAGANANLVVANCTDTPDQMWALRGPIESRDDLLCLKHAGDGSVKLVSCDATQSAQNFTFWMNR